MRYLVFAAALLVGVSILVATLFFQPREDALSELPRESSPSKEHQQHSLPLPEKAHPIPTAEFIPPQDIAVNEVESGSGWMGRILDPEGTPVKGAAVAFVGPLVQHGNYWSPSWEARGITDKDGTFKVVISADDAEKIQMQNATFTAEGGSGSKRLFYSEEVSFRIGEIQDLGDIVLGSEGSNFVGSVLDSEGNPIQGADVHFTFPTGSVSGVTVTTDSNGEFEVAGLRCFGETHPDHFRVYIENLPELFPGKVVSCNPQRANAYIGGGRVDFTVSVRDPEPQVDYGSIVYMGAPRNRVTIALLREGKVVQSIPQPVALSQGESAFLVGVPVSEAKNHTFSLEVSDLETGEYAVCNLRYDPATNRLKGELRRWTMGGEITGFLRDAKGIPQKGVKLSLLQSGSMGPICRISETDSEGRFRFSALPPHTFALAYRTQVIRANVEVLEGATVDLGYISIKR